jgi:para-nitrobenzyl esterase
MRRLTIRRRVTAAMTAGVTALAVISGSALAIATSGSGANSSDDAAIGTTVHTANGDVRGLSTTTANEYLGIPYASPPTGANRWQPPQPVYSWNGVRNATHFRSRCVQGSGWDPGYENLNLNEDCLYLNVYVPHTATSSTPVMVWIHGGGFTGGAGQDTDPRKYIDQNNVVYVTINYRLGAMGFLDLPGLGNGAGNFGLLDQQAALRWVQKNISSFGGDPHNVTIAGQSAGGASVCDQLASPTAKGLFQKAVIMSGGCGMTAQTAAQTSGQTFATYLGCTDPATVVSCLRSKTSAEVLAAQMNSGARMGPAVGGAAFPTDPATAIPAGTFNHVPVMNGQVHDENRLFVWQGNDYLGHPVTAASYEATIRATYGAGADRILAAYPVSSYSSPSIALATVQSDAGSYARYQLDKAFSQYVPTYAYEFAEEDTPQFYSIYRLQQQGVAKFDFGATHVDDLGYLWEYLGHTLPYSDDELYLSDQMIAQWGHFQKTGDPNAAYTPTWPQFQAWNGNWMEQKACDTSESGNVAPKACSQASKYYMTDHKLFSVWQRVLS